ncbi:MAG TPA: NAD(P)-dependent oxidoreductase [Verrucomicrobiae bacterium]|nr:NAD(P)-dependent oxidoreductase [Verrucomicrobiae bacterium]
MANMTARKKLVVTGAHGFVAGSILAQAGDEWQVHAISRGDPLVRRDNLCWHTFDPLAPDELVQIIRAAAPEVVVHTAALADIDLCQTHPEIARAINVDLTRRVAKACTDTCCKLVFCSTDTIFDGEHAPYNENDIPGPVNFYAETKLEAEQIVARLGPQAVIARLSLVVGLPVLGAGNSFLARMLAAFMEGRTVAVPEQEVRTPVDVITVGKALLELAGGNHHGIFHLSGHDRLSRFRMAQQIAVRFGFPSHLVVAQAAAATPGRAARPRDVSLDNGKACANLKTPMRTLDEGISLILETAATSSP